LAGMIAVLNDQVRCIRAGFTNILNLS